MPYKLHVSFIKNEQFKVEKMDIIQKILLFL